MSEERSVCTGCGRSVDLDDHHIVGEAYDSATAPACALGCHQFLSRRQLDNGVDLTRGTPKSEVDRDRAVALASIIRPASGDAASTLKCDC